MTCAADWTASWSHKLRLEQRLEAAGLTCNKKTVGGDPQPPRVTSGLRFGSAAGATQGFGEAEFRRTGGWIADVLHAMSETGERDEASSKLSAPRCGPSSAPSSTIRAWPRRGPWPRREVRARVRGRFDRRGSLWWICHSSPD